MIREIPQYFHHRNIDTSPLEQCWDSINEDTLCNLPTKIYSQGRQVHVLVEYIILISKKYFSWLVALEAIGYSRKNAPHPPSLMDGKLEILMRRGGGGSRALERGSGLEKSSLGIIKTCEIKVTASVKIVVFQSTHSYLLYSKFTLMGTVISNFSWRISNKRRKYKESS